MKVHIVYRRRLDGDVDEEGIRVFLDADEAIAYFAQLAEGVEDPLVTVRLIEKRVT